MSVHIPLLGEIKVRTKPMPLQYAFWRGLVENAFAIRQSIARELRITLDQRECTKRGVETIWGRVVARDLLSPEKKGAEEWLKGISNIINRAIEGSVPISHLQLCRCNKTRFLAYYAPFYGNYMEVIIYIDSGSDVDEAEVTHLERSRVDETTRDWKRLAEQLPLDVWIET